MSKNNQIISNNMDILNHETDKRAQTLVKLVLLVAMSLGTSTTFAAAAADCSATGVEQVNCRVTAAKASFSTAHFVPLPKIRKTLLTDEQIAAELAGGGTDSSSAPAAAAPAASAPASTSGFTYGQ